MSKEKILSLYDWLGKVSLCGHRHPLSVLFPLDFVQL